MDVWPRISIVTPSFNQAKFLSETIESVLSQDYPNFEYVIIDGGSTDGSVEIIQRYRESLKYHCSKKDDGQSDAILNGLSHCNGELFAWVNSDDVLSPGCLKRIAQHYIKHKKPDIIHTNIAYLDPQGLITRFIYTPKQSSFFLKHGVYYGFAPSVFFKTSTFKKVGGLNKDYVLSMDLDIWVKMAEIGARFSHIPEVLGGFRWHHLSKSTQAFNKKALSEDQETLEIMNEHFPSVTQAQRSFWKILFKIYQILNLNYLSAYCDLLILGKENSWKSLNDKE